MTVQDLISEIPANLYLPCRDHNPELIEAAAQGCVNRVNSNGWFWIPREEAVDIFRNACVEYKARFNL
jgi:hypothetical protein